MNFITGDIFYTSREIKNESKAQLQGNWKSGVLLALIPMLFSLFFIGDTVLDVTSQESGNGLSFDLIDLILEFIHAFLLTGVSFTLLDFLRQRADIDPLRGAVSGFKREYFSGLLLLKVYKYLLIIFWTFLFIIPGIIKIYSYSQAEMIYKDRADATGEQPDARACLRESQALMKGHKLDLFILELSFIGWHFLSVFTMGLLYLWLTPYINMANVVFYENLLIKNDSLLGLHEDGADFYEDDELHPREREWDFTSRRRPAARPEPEEEIGKDPDDFRDFEDF